jgi:hypothetical protein
MLAARATMPKVRSNSDPIDTENLFQNNKPDTTKLQGAIVAESIVIVK